MKTNLSETPSQKLAHRAVYITWALIRKRSKTNRILVSSGQIKMSRVYGHSNQPSNAVVGQRNAKMEVIDLKKKKETKKEKWMIRRRGTLLP